MMDTPEKDKLLETVRALRKEAAEKLVGNRQELAVKRLDEIIAVVETQNLSGDEIKAVNNVLVGQVDAAGSAGQVEAIVEHELAVPVQESDVIVFKEDPEVSLAVPEVAVSKSVVSDANENIVDLGASDIETADKPLISGLGTVAAVGSGALAAGMLAKNFVGETAVVVEGGELIDLPEVGDIPVAELVELTDVPGLEVAPESVAIEVDPIDSLDLDVTPIELEVAPEPVSIEVDPIDSLDLDATPIELEVASEPVAIEVDPIDSLDLDAAVVELELPDEGVLLQEIETNAPIVPAIADVSVPEADMSSTISGIVPDIDPSKAAIVAAGAAAATVAAVSIGAGTKGNEIVQPAEVALVPGASGVLTGSTIKHHSSYGGGRGNWVVRFFNALRGRDYI